MGIYKKKGAIFRIENRGYMTWNEFKRIKRDNRLTINSVNTLHNALKARLDKGMRGVSSKWLPCKRYDDFAPIR